MITINVHSEAGLVQTGLPLEAISERINHEDVLLWVDVTDPDEADLAVLRDEFRFHPLALEDAVKAQQRPKVDHYDGYDFLVVYRLARAEEAEIAGSQIGIFFGSNYLVTVHRGTMPPLETVCNRWIRNLRESGSTGIGLLLYSILDTVVDEYMPLMDELSDEIDLVEDQIFESGRSDVQQRVLRLKKNLLAIRRVAAPTRDVMNELIRPDSNLFTTATSRYLLDVYDHLVRVIDATDLYRDLLSTVMDSYLSLASNRLNQVMRTLTASSIILMGMTLVAGVYGMNFTHMPELSWRLGYPMALGLMAIIGIGLALLFRRTRWL